MDTEKSIAEKIKEIDEEIENLEEKLWKLRGERSNKVMKLLRDIYICMSVKGIER